jgi:hypothetical protein
MSITAVPLPPNPPGTLARLWLGLAAIIIAAGGLACIGTRGDDGVSACGANAFLPAGGAVSAPIKLPSGLRFQTVEPGKGAKPTDDDVALISYKGSLKDGSVFDEAPRAPLPVAGGIPGFVEALKMMQRGGKYRLCIPPKLGYGDKAMGDKIPANSTLLFEVGLIDYKSMAEIQAMQQARQSVGGPESTGTPR